ncbi:uncharacterized protein V6R79_020509 [Siganus canaliculatus]
MYSEAFQLVAAAETVEKKMKTLLWFPPLHLFSGPSSSSSRSSAWLGSARLYSSAAPEKLIPVSGGDGGHRTSSGPSIFIRPIRLTRGRL